MAQSCPARQHTQHDPDDDEDDARQIAKTEASKHANSAQLLWIRCGPGALVLPKDVTKLTMEFNTKIYGGHQGARYVC